MASIITSQSHARNETRTTSRHWTAAPVGAGRRTIKATWLTMTEARAQAVGVGDDEPEAPAVYLSRSIMRRICGGSHIPRPLAVGTPRLLSAIAMPYHDVIPPRRSSATMGAS